MATSNLTTPVDLASTPAPVPNPGDFVWFAWDDGEPFQAGVPTEAEVLEVEGDAGDWFALVRIHVAACDVWMHSDDLCGAEAA